MRSNDDRYSAGVLRDRAAIRRDARHRRAIRRLRPRHLWVLQATDYSFHFGGDVGALLKPPEVGGIRTITLSDRSGIRAIRPRSLAPCRNPSPTRSAAADGMSIRSGSGQAELVSLRQHALYARLSARHDRHASELAPPHLAWIGRDHRRRGFPANHGTDHQREAAFRSRGDSSRQRISTWSEKEIIVTRHELGQKPQDPGLPWRLAQGVGRGGGAHASPPAPP